MADFKGKEIPRWQRQEKADNNKDIDPADRHQPSSSSEPDSKPSSNPSTPDDKELSSSRESLLDSATKWLQHESIRDAPFPQKTAFLESKGLTKPEIDQLLHHTPVEPSSIIDTSDSSTPTTSTRVIPPSQSDTSSAHATTSTQPTFQAPPIITYPEFLSHAHKPPPLITTSRLFTAAYGTALTTGVLWAANRYLFNPMYDSLTAARHSLFEGTISNLEQMNTKLEGMVSEVPPIIERPSSRGREGGGGGGGEGGEGDEDAESEASDPAELFHRDVGVQTSPGLATESDEGEGEEEAPKARAEGHAERLNSIRTHLSELSETGRDALEAEEETRTGLGNLQAYLEELAYGGAKSAMSWEGGYGPLGEPMGGARRPQGSSMDEVAKFKAEIRSVKGVLLSARNFPSGGLGWGRGSITMGS